MSNYGERGRPSEHFPDWLLGDRRWKVIECLALQRDGLNAAELMEEVGAGQAWVYELLRALRPTHALEDLGERRYRLDAESALGAALIGLVDALEPLRGLKVDRPPGRRKASSSTDLSSDA